jgi:hypothetical protein
LICNPTANDHKPCGVMKFSNLFRSRPADESSMCTAIAELVMRRLTDRNASSERLTHSAT